MSEIKIKILYFAAAREKVGKTEEYLDFKEELTLGALKKIIFARYQELQQIENYVRWAVSHTFEDNDARLLVHGDEIAVIPPISGG